MDIKSKLKIFTQFLFKPLDKLQFIVFLVYGGLTILLELFSYLFGGFFSIVASRLWFAGFILFVLAFIYIVISKIRQDSVDKVYLLPALFLVIIFFFGFQIGNYGFSDLGYESPQQAVSGLEALEQTDWNYTGTGYIGYPVKQYILNALPSVILGRNFFALSLGFAFPFLMGLTLLFIELREFLRAAGKDENLAMLPILMISFCPFVDEYYYIFEQTITPISFAMIVIALILRTVRQPSFFSFALLLWNVCMLPFLYTPALAFLGLVFVILVYHAVLVLLKKSQLSAPEGIFRLYYVISLFFTAAAPMIFFVCTLIKKREDRFLTPYSDDANPDKFKDYFSAFKTFFIEADSAFFGVFGAFVLIYMVAAFTLRIRRYHLFVSLWCIATSFFSFMLPGAAARFSFDYKVSVLAQRNLVIVPVLAVCILLAAIEIIGSRTIRIRNDILAVICTAFFLFGFNSLFSIHKSYTYDNYIQPMKYIIRYCQEVTEYRGLDYDDEFLIAIHTDNGLLDHPYDYTRYFFPNAVVCNFPTDSYSGVSIYDVIYPRFCFSESEITQDYYYADFKSRTFHNSRFDEDTTLYFYYLEPKFDYVDQYDEEFIAEHDLWSYMT